MSVRLSPLRSTIDSADTTANAVGKTVSRAKNVSDAAASTTRCRMTEW